MTVTRILCLFGIHSPSKRKMLRHVDTYVSQCRRCHKPIMRQTAGRWIIAPHGTVSE